MNKLAAIAAIPLFAGFLMAQSDPSGAAQSATTATSTTAQSSDMWNGTLVDAGCRTTHTAHHENTETTHPDEHTTRTTTTKTDTYRNECPVTETTTTFGLITPEGQYVTFDEPSNTRVVELFKNNKRYHSYVLDKKPVKVKVKGAKKGEVVVIESIQ
jgi:hypothetical protein